MEDLSQFSDQLLRDALWMYGDGRPGLGAELRKLSRAELETRVRAMPWGKGQ